MRKILDRFFAGFAAVVIHLVLIGTLLISLEWTPQKSVGNPQVDVVEAVVVDESKVTQELERLREQERQKKLQEEDRVRKIADRASQAITKRKEEERSEERV